MKQVEQPVFKIGGVWVFLALGALRRAHLIVSLITVTELRPHSGAGRVVTVRYVTPSGVG